MRYSIKSDYYSDKVQTVSDQEFWDIFNKSESFFVSVAGYNPTHLLKIDKLDAKRFITIHIGSGKQVCLAHLPQWNEIHVKFI